MPASLLPTLFHPGRESSLGPAGAFPDTPIRDLLERRWLHYALLTRDLEFGLVANIAWLGLGQTVVERPLSTSILLLYRRGFGWSSSQFNAQVAEPVWSAFSRPCALGEEVRFDVRSVRGDLTVRLKLSRSSHPCTSQCAPFAGNHFLRWQSESGVVARGDWGFRGEMFPDREALGYHERVRGRWGWPQLGGWVFGFANDTESSGTGPPAHALVFTLIQPTGTKPAATGSVMVWRSGRLLRHFPRRQVSVAVRGLLDRDQVTQVPGLSNLFGVPPMEPIPRRLVIHARMGHDYALLDFSCNSAARIVIPNEIGRLPFSVHEVIGPVAVEGRISGQKFGFSTHGIVEFAGGAYAD